MITCHMKDEVGIGYFVIWLRWVQTWINAGLLGFEYRLPSKISTGPEFYDNSKTILGPMINWTVVFLPFQGIFITNFDKSKFRWVSIQDHTSHCHFCSMIDEFPVWNSELIKPWWWVWQFLLSVKRFYSPLGETETLMIASFLYVSLGRECCLSGQMYV